MASAASTFKPETGPLPRATFLPQELPRHIGSHHYTGVGTWNSRGANLQTAFRAMLGDATALVETPELLVRRMQLRRQEERIRLALYPTDRRNGDWGGLEPFLAAAEQVDAWAEAEELEREAETAGQPQRAREIADARRAARQSDGAAVQLSAQLVDRAFFGDSPSRQEMLRQLVAHADDPREQPRDAAVIWSTVYPWEARSAPNRRSWGADTSDPRPY